MYTFQIKSMDHPLPGKLSRRSWFWNVHATAILDSLVNTQQSLRILISKYTILNYLVATGMDM
jgi:hypothetical protein